MVKVSVEFDYDAEQQDELSIKKGDIIVDVKRHDGGWWEGTLNGKTGMFPDNFVKEIQDTASSGPAPPAAVNNRNGEQAPESNVKKIGAMIGPGINFGPAPGKKGSKKPAITAKVLFGYEAEHGDELSLQEGDIVEILNQDEEGWWEGLSNGKRGMFPSNFVKINEISEPVNKRPVAGQSVLPPLTGEKPGKILRPPPDASVRTPAAASSSAPGPKLPERSQVGKKRCKARVLFSYHAVNSDELTLEEGQMLMVLDRHLEDPGWWKGELQGKIGVFPDNFVEILPDEQLLAPQQPTAAKPMKPPAPIPAPSSVAAPAVEERDRPHKPSLLRSAVPPPPGTKPAKLPPTTPESTIPQSSRDPPKTNNISSDSSAPVINPTQPLPVSGKLTTEVEALRRELEQLKTSTISLEKFQNLEKELNLSKSKIESYKKESKQAFLDLKKEYDRIVQQNSNIQVEIASIRQLAESSFMKD